MTTPLPKLIEKAKKLVELLEKIQTKQTSEKAAPASLAHPASADPAVASLNNASAALAPPASAAPDASAVPTTSHEAHAHETSDNADASKENVKPHDDASDPQTVTEKKKEHNASAPATEVKPVGVTSSHHASADNTATTNVTPGPEHASSSNATTNGSEHASNAVPPTNGSKHASSTTHTAATTARGGTIKRKRRMTKGKGRKTMKH